MNSTPPSPNPSCICEKYSSLVQQSTFQKQIAAELSLLEFTGQEKYEKLRQAGLEYNDQFQKLQQKYNNLNQQCGELESAVATANLKYVKVLCC